MARANLLRPSVNAGEFSPRMAARVDMRQYPFAAETLKHHFRRIFFNFDLSLYLMGV